MYPQHMSLSTYASTYISMSQFQCVHTTYVTENKENYLSSIICPLSLRLLYIPNCQLVVKYMLLFDNLTAVSLNSSSLTIYVPRPLGNGLWVFLLQNIDAECNK